METTVLKFKSNAHLCDFYEFVRELYTQESLNEVLYEYEIGPHRHSRRSLFCMYCDCYDSLRVERLTNKVKMLYDSWNN